jgi:hypothetical protein
MDMELKRLAKHVELAASERCEQAASTMTSLN